MQLLLLQFLCWSNTALHKDMRNNGTCLAPYRSRCNYSEWREVLENVCFFMSVLEIKNDIIIKFCVILLFCSVVMRLNFTSFFYYSQTFVTFCKKKRVICVDRSVARSVSYRFITTKTRFPSEVNQCGIIGGQNDTETGFSPSTLLFPRQRYALKAPFWRHIISVAYRVVISTFKRVS